MNLQTTTVEEMAKVAWAFHAGFGHPRGTLACARIFQDGSGRFFLEPAFLHNPDDEWHRAVQITRNNTKMMGLRLVNLLSQVRETMLQSGKTLDMTIIVFHEDPGSEVHTGFQSVSVFAGTSRDAINLPSDEAAPYAYAFDMGAYNYAPDTVEELVNYLPHRKWDLDTPFGRKIKEQDSTLKTLLESWEEEFLNGLPEETGCCGSACPICDTKPEAKPETKPEPEPEPPRMEPQTVHVSPEDCLRLQKLAAITEGEAALIIQLPKLGENTEKVRFLLELPTGEKLLGATPAGLVEQARRFFSNRTAEIRELLKEAL
jgi:hypothetical protein